MQRWPILSCGAWGQCVCFVSVVVEVVFQVGLCYTCYFIVCFQWCFFSVCFVLLVNGYVYTEQTLNEFNKLQPLIKFTMEKELHEEINFLDLTIHRKDKRLEFSI
jgi:hypothetical protein